MIWNIRDGRPAHTLKGHKAGLHPCVTLALTNRQGEVWQVVYSKTGNLLVSGSKDETIRIWNARSGELLDILQESVVHPIFCVTMAPTEDYVAEGSFGSVPLDTALIS